MSSYLLRGDFTSESAFSSFHIMVFCILTFAILIDIGMRIRTNAPLASGYIPLLGHSLLFLRDKENLSQILRTPTTEPLKRFTTPLSDFWLVKDPKNVWTVLSNPQVFDAVGLHTFFMKNVLGMPKTVIAMICKDTSGISSKPLPGSNIPADRRFGYLKHKATVDVIGRTGLTTLKEQFETHMDHWIHECDIGNDWIRLPDLYMFLRDMLFETSVNAFFGPRLLQQSPNLKEDLWRFDDDVSMLANGLPKIFAPSSRTARDKCIQAVKRWRQSAFERHSTGSNTGDWDPVSGLKCFKMRNDVFREFEEWDAEACAASDTAVLWAAVTNVIPATFWYFFETIRSPSLHNEARKEVLDCCTDETEHKFDVHKLIGQPLLQSIYAETLRTYVAILMVRESKALHRFGSWEIPKNEKVVCCSYTEHMNPSLWNTGTPEESHPVTEFWGKRFLAGPPAAPVFSAEGPAGRWLPYGLGERMCPGRHFAKVQMLSTFAKLTSEFEIVLQTPTGWRPDLDFDHFGFGTLPPKEQIPFCIRRKAKAS